MTPFVDLAVKSILTAVGAAIVGGITKGLLWIREVKTNHLPHIQAAVEAIPTALERQTAVIVQELKEQRADIRVLITKS